MRLVSWNLFHGRAVPDEPRPLLHEFAATLAGLPWDVALLQEVPPWWPPLLAGATGAHDLAVRTSRNAGLPVRRAVACRRPDLARSNGGGANAILVRPPLRVLAHGRRRLRLWPERRWLHAALVVGPGDDEGPVWVGNVHAEPPSGGRGGPAPDVPLALARLEAWAGAAGAPLVLGGDLNLRPAAVDAVLPPGWSRAASRDVDHVLVREPATAGAARVLPHGRLSDHPPLAVELRPGAAARASG